MIKKIDKEMRAKALEYLHTSPVNALAICEAAKYYGIDSEHFSLWGDFWVDGEIKCLFAKIEDVIYIFSNSPAVDTMDIYTFLRDNYIGYKYVIGQAEKIKGYQRHILFKYKREHSAMILNKKDLTVPDFSRQKATLISEAVAEEVAQFINESEDFKFHPLSPKAIMKYTEKYGGYYVRARGRIAAVGIGCANIRKLMSISVLITDEKYKEDYGYTEMIVSRIAQSAFAAGYRGICTDNVSEGYEKALKRLGFEHSTQNLLLKR